MGYYSSFNLTLEKPDGVMVSDEAIIAALREKYKYAEIALWTNGGTLNEAKWYDCEDDLRAFSKSWPLVLFKMKVRGEDYEEYIYYVRNGKSCTIEPDIIWPEFDPEELA